MIELIVGREEGKEQPRLAVTKDGKVSYFGQPGSVPKWVSRKHCMIQIADDFSNMTITDISENNFMFINDVECKSKGRLKIDAKVELGPNRYPLDLTEILRVVTAGQTFHIAHLKEVYEDYHKSKMDYQIRQNRFNALSAIPTVFSMSSMALAFILKEELIRVIMVCIAVIGIIVFAVIRMRNSSRGPVKLKAMDDKFHSEYVCPNPLCGRFLGSQQYIDLIRGRACPYCKSKYIE